MNRLIKLLAADDHDSLSIRVLNLIVIYADIASIVSAIYFALSGYSLKLIMSIVGVFCLFTVIGMFSRIVCYQKLSLIIFCCVFNLIILPAMFLSGGGVYSGMPVLLMAGYIITFIFLSGLALALSCVGFTVWYMILIVYSYYYPAWVTKIPHHTMLWDLIICLFFTSAVMVIVLGIYGRIYKKLQYTIEIAKKTIEETGVVKSRFLANMSHELRTPMNAILGMAELLEREDKNSSIVVETAMIKESAFSLLTTINNVLTFSKLDSHKMEYMPGQFNFGKLLRDVIYTISMETSNKNITFIAEVDPQIPDVMYGDASRIRQVFNYILFNAAKDTDNGRIMMDVSFARNPKKNNVTIFARISDTGIGLSDDEKNSIFRSFEIYDSRKNSQLKRLGLEFTICRDILELMDGSIRVESINGVGTSVYFQFDIFNIEKTPIVKIERQTNQRALIYDESNSGTQILNSLMNQFGLVPDFVSTYAAFDMRMQDKRYDFIFITDKSYQTLETLIQAYNVEDVTYVLTDSAHVYGDFGRCRILRRPITCLNISEAVSGTWNKDDYLDKENRDSFTAPDAKILVVDDNIVNIKVATGLLQKYGIQASIATSGAEALDKSMLEKYDLILLDQVMPEMDGIETLKRFRSSVEEHYRKVPIVCMTANMGNEVREDLLKQGFQEYLAKPVKIKYLEEILKTFLPDELIQVVKATEKEVAAAEPAPSAEAFPPGLSVDAGLLRCGGDAATYAAILNTYYQEGAEKLAVIPEQLENDLPLFIINVHAVKGSSASIGGLEVSELYRQLEMAGKGGDIAFLHEHLDVALSKYSALLEDIKAYLTERGEFESEEEESAELEETEFDINEMKALAEYIDDFDTELAEGLIQQWSEHNYGDEINSYIRFIKRAVDSFDLEKAGELANEFLEVFS